MRQRNPNCRVCKLGGYLVHGAHPECKRAVDREHKRKLNGTVVYTKCRECGTGGELNRAGRHKDCQEIVRKRLHAANLKRHRAKAKAEGRARPTPKPAKKAAALEPRKPLIAPKRAVEKECVLLDTRPTYGPYEVPRVLPQGLRDYFGVHGPIRSATDDWAARGAGV